MFVSLDKVGQVIKILEMLKLNYKVFYVKSTEIVNQDVNELIPYDNKSVDIFIYAVTDVKESFILSFSQMTELKKKLL